LDLRWTSFSLNNFLREPQLCRNVFTFEINFAPPRQHKVDDRIDQRGLADTVPAKRTQDLTLLKLERQTLKPSSANQIWRSD